MEQVKISQDNGIDVVAGTTVVTNRSGDTCRLNNQITLSSGDSCTFTGKLSRIGFKTRDLGCDRQITNGYVHPTDPTRNVPPGPMEIKKQTGLVALVVRFRNHAGFDRFANFV